MKKKLINKEIRKLQEKIERIKNDGDISKDEKAKREKYLKRKIKKLVEKELTLRDLFKIGEEGVSEDLHTLLSFEKPPEDFSLEGIPVSEIRKKIEERREKEFKKLERLLPPQSFEKLLNDEIYNKLEIKLGNFSMKSKIKTLEKIISAILPKLNKDEIKSVNQEIEKLKNQHSSFNRTKLYILAIQNKFGKEIFLKKLEKEKGWKKIKRKPKENEIKEEIKKIYCPFCREEIKPDTISCPNCKTNIKEKIETTKTSSDKKIYCPFCKGEINPIKKFCSHCGANIAQIWKK